MLRQEKQRRYFVFPSWGTFRYSWKELPEILRDPIHSGYLDPKIDYKSLGFSDSSRLCVFNSGPFGGGIIVEHINSSQRWLGGLILGNGASILAPAGLYAVQKSFTTPVYYLDPDDSPGTELGVGKRAKRYICAASPENINTVCDSIFWVVGHDGGEKISSAIDSLGSIRDLFDISVTRLGEPPKLVCIETAHWFIGQPVLRTWFRVESTSQDANGRAGYHFSVLVYVAFHLKMLLRNRLHWMHLVSNIEGSPNIRFTWGKPSGK